MRVLTEKEEGIIRAIVDRQTGKKSFTTPDYIDIGELGVYLYDVYGMKMPTHWKAALAVTMRGLIAKVNKHRLTLKRTSDLGRGRMATYEFSGDYARFLKEHSKAEH